MLCKNIYKNKKDKHIPWAHVSSNTDVSEKSDELLNRLDWNLYLIFIPNGKKTKTNYELVQIVLNTINNII